VFLRPLADSASSSGAIQLVRAEHWFSDLAGRKK